MRTVVFINAHSRQATQYLSTVKKFFERSESPFELLDFIVATELQDFKKYLEKLRSHSTMECLVVGSGDGTIVSLLNEFKQRRNLVYGFLPLGTGNTFVRSLGLPLDCKKALRILDEQHIRPVNLGSINGTRFANIADIGVPAQVADQLTNRVKRYLGSFAYAVSGIRELVRHDAIWCELEIDGKKTSFYTHQVLIANGQFRGPVIVNKDVSVYSDQLMLGYSDTMSRWEYLRDAFGFLVGSPDKRKTVFFLPIERARLRTKPAQIIQADGEIIGKTPADIRIIKDAIRALTPPDQPQKPRRGTRRIARRARKSDTTK